MVGRPRVSIGLPTYNGERYLADAIRSVLAQDHDDLELVVSDNASTDATPDIVADFAREDARVKYFRAPENRGAAWNYNQTFELSTGEMFKWQADDDLCEPALVRRCVETLDAHPEAVLAHTWTRMIDDDGEVLREFQDDLHATAPDVVDRFKAVIPRVRFCNEVFGLVRSDVLRRTALIAPYPGSDHTLLLELSLHGTFAVVPEYLFVRRPGRSIPANRDALAITRWFDTSRRAPMRFVVTRHARANAVAIGRAPIGPSAKARAWGSLATTWGPHYVRRYLRRRRRGEMIRG